MSNLAAAAALDRLVSEARIVVDEYTRRLNARQRRRSALRARARWRRGAPIVLRGKR